MNSLKQVMVVDRERKTAEPIVKHFLEEIGKQYQASIHWNVAEEGFSHLIRTNGAKAFLGA
jgi:hypothetical protein